LPTSPSVTTHPEPRPRGGSPGLPAARRFAGAVFGLLAILTAVGALSPLFALDAHRSPDQYTLRIWGKREGLPGSWVKAVLPSRTGYLWIATPDGLLRFDGFHFTSYGRKTSPSLPTDNVLSLCEGRDGRLWVGTFRGLVVGSARGNTPFTAVEGGPATSVLSIVEARDGAIWAVTAQAIWRVEGSRATSMGPKQGLPGDRYRALSVDASGVLWLATNAGIARLEDGKVAAVYSARDGLISNDALSVLADREGVLWVGTGQGIARRDAGGRFERVAAAGARVVMALFEDRDRNVWAGTRDGLLRVAGGSPDLMGRSAGLPDEHISSLAEDLDGNFWVGTEAGGLARLRDGRATVFGAAQGLTHEVVWTVLEGRDGSVWAATDGGGLNRLVGTRAARAGLERSFDKENIYALFEDRAGRIWFSTEWHGLCRLANGRTTCIAKPFGDDLVRCMLEDTSGKVWIGTSTALMRMENDVATSLPTEDNRKITVTSLLEASPGVLWVGTTSGLARMEGGVVRRVLIGGKPHADYVNAIHADADGTLWLATTDSGLQRLRGGHLVSVTSKQGMPSDSVLSVVTDRDGRYWVSSGQGIFGFTRADLDEAASGRSGLLRAVAVTEAEGLRDRECSGGLQPSAWVGRDGRIWYPTIAGVAVVDPARSRLNQRLPSVSVEEIVVDGGRPSLDGPLALPAGTRHIEIHYTAPNFAAPERVRFQHRLEGLDPEFFEAGADRTAHYSALAPGHYRFVVRAANEDGVWGEAGAPLEFSVTPYFWQTIWFYAVSGVMLVAMAAGAFEWRVRSLRARQQDLKRRVAEEMARVRVLTGLLPVCSWCRKVRDDAGSWRQLEAYVHEHSEAEFTHGICPECLKKVDLPPEQGPVT